LAEATRNFMTAPADTGELLTALSAVGGIAVVALAVTVHEWRGMNRST
jgi:hypothetical protein